MRRFTSSAGKEKLLSLKKKRKTAAEQRDEDLLREHGGGGFFSGATGDGGDDGFDGAVESYDLASNASDVSQDEQDWRATRGAATSSSSSSGGRAAKAAEANQKKKKPLRLRGPLDASLSSGRYAAAAVEDSMDDIFGTLDMADLDAEADEEVMWSGADDDDDDDVEFDGSDDDAEDEDDNDSDAKAHPGKSKKKKVKKAKDLSQEEYMAFLEKKRAREGPSRRHRRGVDDVGADVRVEGEEGDIMDQLESLRRVQVGLVQRQRGIKRARGGNNDEDASDDDDEGAARAEEAERDAAKEAVKHYTMLFSQLLRVRVRLQPCVTRGIGFPQYYALPLFLDESVAADAVEEEAENNSSGTSSVDPEELQESLDDVRADLAEVLGALFSAASGQKAQSSGDAARPEKPSAAKKKKKKADKDGDNGSEAAFAVPTFRQLADYQTFVRDTANTSLEFWGAKLVKANSAKLKTISQPLPQQIAAILTAKTRLRAKVQKNRSHLRILAHPTHARAAGATGGDAAVVDAAKAQRAETLALGDVDEEIYDDSDFLRELVRRGGAVANRLEQQLSEMNKQLLPAKEAEKKGFHRMTKGKTVNYEPRPKIVGFVMAEGFDGSGRNDVVVSSLFQ